MTAVGGTSLSLDSSNDLLSEVGWSGSGGGISSYESDTFQEAQGSAARRVYETRYSEETNYQSLLTIYRDAISADSSGCS